MALNRWSIPEFPAPEENLTLITAQQAKETILLSIIITNYSNENNSKIEVTHKDINNNIILKWKLDLLVTDSPFVLDSKIVLNGGDTISVKSNITEVSVLASGDES